MKTHHIGIDFGTTKTLVSHVNPQTRLPEIIKLGRDTYHLPTTIYIDANGRYSFGDDADDMIEEETGCYIRGFKMKLGSDAPMHLLPDGSIFARDLVREYLHFIRKQVEELVYHGERVTKATITRPVKFSPLQCKELEAAALDAGYTEVSFITEPEAAGLAYCHLNAVQAFTRAALVVDWGGGTLDFALVTRKDDTVCTHSQLTEGDTRMGGEKFDERLWLYAQQKLDKAGAHELNHISQLPHVRKAKEMLSSRTEITLRLSSITGACPRIEISRNSFNKLIKDDIQKAVYKMQELIKRIPAEMQPEMILLVGGSCQIPLIQQQLKKASGLPTHAWDRSSEAVSLGAALVSNPEPEEEEAEQEPSENPAPHETQTAPADTPAPEKKKSSGCGVWFTFAVIIAACLIKNKCSSLQNKIPPAPPVTQEQTEQPADSQQQSYAAILYSTGEQYFNNKQYKQAVEHFSRAAEQGHADAQIWLGFCYENGHGVSQNYNEAVNWYRKAAEQGHAHAQSNLGYCYDTGHGVSQNYNEAVSWYRKAAEQGNAYAQNNLGVCYENGHGVSQNYNEAVKWYRKAAEQGHADAQTRLGNCYLNGQGVSQNYSEAVKWYRKAAEQGFPVAQTWLGWCYCNGQGVPQNYSESANWYRKAAEQNYPLAQSELGFCYYNGQGVSQNYSEAVSWFHKAAEQGFVNAQGILGECYENGHGVPQNHSEAVSWFRKAAEQNHPVGQTSLGNCYYNGHGVSQNYSEAVKWYRKAAEQGHADAQTRLGNCYLNGHGVSQNYGEAVRWFRKAAEQGHADAQYNLGVCYYNGQGVSQNYSEAVNWYRKAAEQGDAGAQNNLGVCYDTGHGVSQNYNEAVSWYRKAAEQGHEVAQTNLGACYSNGHGVSQNYNEAVSWYRKAAEQGLADAQYNLGVCYKNGHGVTKNVDEAIHWYRKAAQQGIEEAQTILDELNNSSAPQPNEFIPEQTKKAASELLRKGRSAEKKRDYRRAAELFEQAARMNNKSAQYRLGRCYEKGQGKEKDLTTALNWYRRAAQRAHAPSEHAIAMLLNEIHQISTGRTRNYEAEEFAYRAFIHGETKALKTLGELLSPCYITSQGVYEKSLQAARNGEYESAKSLMKEAVYAGNAAALYSYGKAILEQNPADGLKHLTFSAAQGYGPALFKLGQLYKNGSSCCKKNEKLGDFLLKRSENAPAY